MTKAEFQKLHGFDEETMELIDAAVKIFGGKIIEVKDLTKKRKDVNIPI